MKKIGLFLILVLSMFLCACSSKQKKENEMYIYYLNADKNTLIREIYPIMNVQDTLKKMEFHGVLSSVVRVEKYKQNSTTLELYFDTNYFRMTKSQEVLTRAAIVQTLVQLHDIDFVSFYIGEDPLTDGKGQVIGKMSADDFVEHSGAAEETYQTADIILYFADGEGTGLKQQKIQQVRYHASSSIERVIVEQLMNGTSKEGYQSTIPKEATLLGVSVKDDICYVNLDSKFVTDSYDLDPQIEIYSIVNSLIANGTVSKVQILIDGSSNVMYKNSVDLSVPLIADADLLR